MKLTRLTFVCACLAVAGCSTTQPSTSLVQPDTPTAMYRIGPLDGLEIFVWRSPELSRGVTVRPDGRISVPLIDDLVATGKTPTQLARDIETQLKKFVQDPTVTV